MKTLNVLALVVAFATLPGCRCKKKVAPEAQEMPVLHVEERVSGVETALGAENLK